MSIGHILGGALQGAGLGMLEQQKQAILERRERALAAAKEGYTLGENQVRYDASGKEIARGPTKAPNLPGLAEELQAAGYKPGTPEFEKAMRSVINSKYASDYVDESGNTRRRSALNLDGASSGSAASAGVPQPKSQSEYDALPPGAQYLAPDGSRRTKGGPTPSASGSFR